MMESMVTVICSFKRGIFQSWGMDDGVAFARIMSQTLVPCRIGIAGQQVVIMGCFLQVWRNLPRSILNALESDNLSMKVFFKTSLLKSWDKSNNNSILDTEYLDTFALGQIRSHRALAEGWEICSQFCFLYKIKWFILQRRLLRFWEGNPRKT